MSCLFPHTRTHGVCTGHDAYVATAHVMKHVTPLMTPFHAGRYHEENPASLVLTTHGVFPVEQRNVWLHGQYPAARGNATTDFPRLVEGGA